MKKIICFIFGHKPPMKGIRMRKIPKSFHPVHNSIAVSGRLKSYIQLRGAGFWPEKCRRCRLKMIAEKI